MPNDDYIMRSDALKAVHYENWREGDYPHTIDTLHLTEYQLLAEAINNVPAADVEPVRRWIPVTERLPEELISPLTRDYQPYPCVFRSADGEREVRYYKFGRGHFWHGPGCMDEYVTHWAEPMELPEGEAGRIRKADSERMLFMLKSLEEAAERKGQVTVSGDFLREIAEIMQENAEIIQENAEIIREMKSKVLIAKVPENFHDLFDSFGESRFLSPLKAAGECGAQGGERRGRKTMDKVDRERVLYALEALEKVTEPGGFATVSGTLIREIAEIIREREGGILIASDEVRAPKSCGECFAENCIQCIFDSEDRFLPILGGKPHWCPLKEGFLKE